MALATATATATAIEVVLFDLGGVLIELGGIRELASFAGEPGNPAENREPTRAAEDELWRRWLTCPWVRRFERGECDADSFARGMVDSWSMNVGPETPSSESNR